MEKGSISFLQLTMIWADSVWGTAVSTLFLVEEAKKQRLCVGCEVEFLASSSELERLRGL